MASAATCYESRRNEPERTRRSRLRKWDRMSRRGVDFFIESRPDDFWRLVYRGIPPEHRWAVWKSRLLVANSVTFGREAKEREKALFSGPSATSCVAGLLSRESSWSKHIQASAVGMPSELPGFDEDYQHSFCRVLNAYAFLNPEVGYVQGMDSIVGVLLLASGRSERETLFVVMRLMEDCGLSGFYRDGSPLLQQYMLVFDELMDDIMPDFRNHFVNEGVQTTDYLHHWLMSLFTCCLPLQTALLIWDIVMCNGLPYLVLAAIALLSSVKEVLLAKRKEEILQFFASMKHDDEDDCTALEVGLCISNKIQRLGKSSRVKRHLAAITPEAYDSSPMTPKAEESEKIRSLDLEVQQEAATPQDLAFKLPMEIALTKREKRVSFNLETKSESGIISWYQL